MPSVSPFRALRYDETAAGPLADLIAPPYDVIDDDGAARVPRPQPVQRRPPDPSGDARGGRRGARRLARARRAARGGARALVARPGLRRPGRRRAHARGARRRDRGDAVRGRARCCRTSARTPARRRGGSGCSARRGRSSSRSSCSTTPTRRSRGRTREPELDVEEGGVRTRVWRLPPRSSSSTCRCSIADGHHRYETAVAFREEDPAATHTFAVLVSSRSPGLEIFPTHRLVPALAAEPSLQQVVTWDRSALGLYRGGRVLPGRLRRRARRARGRAVRRERRRLHARTPRRRSPPSTAARPRPRSSSARPRSRRWRRSPRAARRCRRSRRSSSRS